MKTTQLEFIKNELLTKGFITRNYCLQNYISRLGARINDLSKEGWIFETKQVKTDLGTDYEYRLKFAPVSENKTICHLEGKKPPQASFEPNSAPVAQTSQAQLFPTRVHPN